MQNDKVKIIVKLFGRSFDFTDFQFNHPGGSEIFVEMNGKDATQIFEEAGHMKPGILQDLKQYEIDKDGNKKYPIKFEQHQNKYIQNYMEKIGHIEAKL